MTQENKTEKLKEGQGPAQLFHHQIRAINSEKRVVALIGGTGSGKCVSEDELIPLANGARVRAGDLVGDDVFHLLTVTEGGIDPVGAVASWAETEEVFALESESGRRVVRNAQHPFYCGRAGRLNGRTPQLSVLGWRELGNLKIGDLVAVTEDFPAWYANNEIPEHELKLLAYFIGDGGLRGSSPVFTQEDNVQLEEFKKLISELGCEAKQSRSRPYDYYIIAKGVSGSGNWRDHPNNAIKLLKRYGLWGKFSWQRRIPENIFSLTKGQLAVFLNRLFSTDGWAHCRENNRGSEIAYGSSSIELVRDVQQLLLRFGISSRIDRKERVDSYTLSLCTSEDKIRFAEAINIYGKESVVDKVKAQSLGVSKNQTWRHLKLPPGLRWEKVKSIRSEGIKQTVAITVPAYQTYLTTFFEHNTWLAPYIIITKWLMIPNSRAMAIGLGYTRHVERIMIRRMEEFCGNWKIPYTMNRSTATLTLRNNNSQLIFGSSENPLSLEGAHLEGGCWLDECGQMPRLAWEVAERRTNLHKAPLLLTSVPYYTNWLKKEVYDPYLAGTRTDVDWINCRSLDNLSYDPEVIAEIKARRRPEYFSIFFEGEFSRPFGLIYDDPSSDEVIVSDPEVEFPQGIPNHWPCFAGFDFGMNDPCAGIWARLDPNNDILYIVAEYEAPSLTMRAHIDRWRQAGLEVDAAFGDPSGADQMATAEELGYPIQKANNDILAGIDLVYDRFKTGRLKVFPNCRTLIDYREQYVWAKNANDEDELLDKPANPQPARHIMDALRYLVIGLQENFMMMDERGPVVSVRRKAIQTNYG